MKKPLQANMGQKDPVCEHTGGRRTLRADITSKVLEICQPGFPDREVPTDLRVTGQSLNGDSPIPWLDTSSQCLSVHPPEHPMCSSYPFPI